MNSYPCFAWRNLLCEEPDLQIQHSPDAVGYPFANISDWRDYTLWKSSGTGELYIKLDASFVSGQTVAVDTLAVFAHNLYTAGVTGVKLEWSNDDIMYNLCFPAFDPEDDRLIFKRFTEQDRRFFKMTIPAGYSGTPEIGILFIGTSDQIPAFPESGFDPQARESILAAESSRTGRLLGVAARFERREIKAEFSRLPPSFITDTWLPFYSQHGTKPFFFSWDPDTRPEETYLARLSEPRLSAPFEKSWQNLSLSMTGRVE